MPLTFLHILENNIYLGSGLSFLLEKYSSIS